jgi:hypothetical protein
MNRFLSSAFCLLLCTAFLFSCKKDDPEMPAPSAENGPYLILKLHFDEDQQRLDNFGNPAVVPSGHATQTPQFNTMSAHYAELIPNALTWLGEGEVLYEGPETTAGGDLAIDFDQAVLVGEGEEFQRIPLSSITAGQYEYLRMSLSYQNFDISLQASGINLDGTLAGFIGFNNYISNYTIEGDVVEVNGNKLQGYWGFESDFGVIEGQAPEGATTVVNPLWDSSPIPPGSCLVTGEFPEALSITGNETEDIEVVVSLSVNNSFEWVDSNDDGIYQPAENEPVVDMGIRGMIPTVQQ